MKLPNFLIVGAAKAGTTSLFYYLKQHPEIFMPEEKELKFFEYLIIKNKLHYTGPGDNKSLKRVVKTWDEYKNYFKKAKNFKAVGEASVSYLYYTETIKNIKKYLGENINIIIILRNPIERLISNYKYMVMRGREKEDLKKALELEEYRKNQGFYRL